MEIIRLLANKNILNYNIGNIKFHRIPWLNFAKHLSPSKIIKKSILYILWTFWRLPIKIIKGIFYKTNWSNNLIVKL